MDEKKKRRGKFQVQKMVIKTSIPGTVSTVSTVSLHGFVWVVWFISCV
jgi:hypothetical protein